MRTYGICLLRLLALAAIVTGPGCGRSGAKPGDAGADARLDTPADFGSAGGASSGGAAGGATGAGGGPGGISGSAGESGNAGQGLGGVSGSTGGDASAGAGNGGSSGATGGASVGGTGGARPPLLPCIDGWPVRPANVAKVAPLSVQPGILWMKSLPSSTAAGGIGRGMAVTGSGAAFASGYTLLIYDGDGGLVASVAKPQQTGYISTPVAGADGSLYFADSTAAYRVDGRGQPIWQKPLGASQISGTGAPRQPALDPAGRLHISGMDGNLWTFRVEDGQVIASVNVGLGNFGVRSLQPSVGNVLFADWSGKSAAGPGIDALGLLAADTGSLLADVVEGQAAPYIIPGYDIGFVVGVVINSETYDVFTTDRCGNFRWRVPGDHAVPLALTFDDDLIVMDRTPTGKPSPNNYDFALRRFSKDGALRAGPVSVPDQFCGNSFVGADDTFYYAGGASDGYRLRAFDASLNELWAIPFPFCPNAAVLAEGGKIFAARTGQIAATQTTSPGPARVSWAQIGRDARATLWLAP